MAWCWTASALMGCAEWPKAAEMSPKPTVMEEVVPPEGVAYLWQSVVGHWQVLQAARPVAEWLADPATPTTTASRLQQTAGMRRFAVQELALPDNASYTRYADLQRPAVVWNVVVAPSDSLKLQTWCFPLMGCVGYRGYFLKEHAQAFARQWAQQGWDTLVYPVPAYSTLGWTNWLGGDPLLNTMLAYPQGELARLLFHELAHQQVYAADDTAFNESYATAVERLGGARWMALAGPEVVAEFERFDARRQAFRALTRETRKNLKKIYGSPLDSMDVLATKNINKNHQISEQKALIMHTFRHNYERLKAEWGGYSGYDAWVAQANNAAFAVQAAYDQWVPAFEALFAREGHDFAAFHAAVARLAKWPAAQRQQALQALMPE